MLYNIWLKKYCLKNFNLSNRSTKLWRPKILKLIFYTEILDKYFSLTCTRRTLELIEQAKGFDNYILKVNLKSFLFNILKFVM